MIYLDSAATTIVHPDVAKAIYKSMLEDIGNPSSLHRLGLDAELRVRKAREDIATFLRVPRESLTFTSGGTESNNIAIIGGALARKNYGNHIITTKIEHPSVLAPFKYLEENGFNVTYLGVDRQGYIDLGELKHSLTEDTILISVMHVNNEIGTIQPIEEISDIVKRYSQDIYIHVDGIQSFGKLKLYPKEKGIDILTFSGHKIHAPKGIGGIYIDEDITIHPITYGGGQEAGLRSGTENLPGIVGLAEAVKVVKPYVGEDENPMYRLKHMLAEGILERVEYATINGPEIFEGAPHILSISFPGIRSEVMLHALEERGVYVSSGSACSSKRSTTSHVLEAIGVSKTKADGSIRFSLSYMNTENEIAKVPDIIAEILEELEPFMRR